MARYVIGDVQGCFDELMQLLGLMNYRPESDCLYLVGDLVNRGPKSLEVLRWVMNEQSHVSTVLGNHDLHLLACYVGAAQCKDSDTLDAILGAADVSVLLDWLRRQPLLIALEDVLIVHAGILPAWDENMALMLAGEVSTALASDEYREFVLQMYGNKPRAWSADLAPFDRMRLAINAFTRMRMVDETGALDFKFKGELEKAPPILHPWFNHPARRLKERKVVCGHWSALGLLQREDVASLDTGCVWGGQLTALRLDDGKIFQIQAKQAYQSTFE